MASSKLGGAESEIRQELFQPGLRGLFLVGILIAVGVNLIQFEAIDRTAARNYRAIFDFGNKDLFSIATRWSPAVRLYVDPFYYFGVISPNSTVVLPSTHLSSRYALAQGMMSFGRARKLKRRKYDPQAPLNMSELKKYQVDLKPYAQQSQKAFSAMNGRFSIFRRSPEAHTFVVFAPEGSPGREKPMFFVDIDLLDKSMQKALR